MKNALLLVSFLLLSTTLLAQKQNNVWCFGLGCGINFNSGAPVSFSTCAMHQLEGSASISDSNGNLLFYTDGDTIWNANNTVMPNGSDPAYNLSTTQAALIVNSLSNKNQYYVFTAEAFDGEYGGKGFNYSIVDMTLQGGLGDVVANKKDKHLLDTVDERIAATEMAGDTGVWIVASTRDGKRVDAFKLTASGVDTVPVVTTTGVLDGYYSGCMKISPDGSKLAMAEHSDEFDIFDFDRATGTVSNGVYIVDAAAYDDAYGVEFSPSGKYLYGTSSVNAYLYQFDLTAGDIAASAVKLFNSTNQLGTMQLAPDGKIYVARYFSEPLGVINNPDEPGLNCNYSDTGFSLKSGWCQFGLPNIFWFEPSFTGIKQVDSYAGATVFPNPATNTCELKTATSLYNEPYTLFDITGRPINKGWLNGTSTTIALNNLAPGIYLLQTGNITKHVFKVIKE